MKKRLWIFVALLLTFAGLSAAMPEHSAAAGSFSLSPYTGDTAEQEKEAFTYYDEVGAFLIGDPVSGKIVLEKGSATPQGIASMTKLLTYYILKTDLAEGKIHADDPVTTSAHAATYNRWDSSNYGMNQGEVYTVDRLMTAMMVVSGNDAATALAEHDAGSEDAFVTRMNQVAKEIGMEQSSFVNASGFTLEDGRYNISTARDMFVLASRIPQQFPEVRDYIAIYTLSEPEREYVVQSTLDASMSGIPGMLGMKTGMTEEAGYCFTGAFEITSSVDGTDFSLVTVCMGAESGDARWRTTKEMVDLAAGSFSLRSIVDASVPITRYTIPNAEEESVVLYPAQSYQCFTFADRKFDVRYLITEGIKAPTEGEAKFGEIIIYSNNEVMTTIDIVSHVPTTTADWMTRLQRGLAGFFAFVTSFW